MTEDEFRRLAASYGADITRWPARHQAAARALAGTGDPRAQAPLRQEAALDALLARARPQVEVGQAERVIAAVLRDTARGAAVPRRLSWRTVFGWRPSLALAAMTVLGLCIGAALDPSPHPASGLVAVFPAGDLLPLSDGGPG
jgi:anti-sigma-K factor RskA